MCEPVTALTVASGGMGAIGSYQSASAAASAQNEGAIRSYKHQLKVREQNWNRERERYGHQIAQYRTQTLENDAAANRAYVSEQQRLNNIYKKAGFAQQNQLVKLAQSSGKMAASGRSGQSTQRLDTDVVSQFGRNQAIMAESLLGAQSAFASRTGAINRKLTSAQNDAYSQVAIAPEPGVAPSAPVMRQGPSGLSLAAGLLGAGVDGAKAYKQFGPRD
jgi:hypothetical protein